MAPSRGPRRCKWIDKPTTQHASESVPVQSLRQQQGNLYSNISIQQATIRTNSRPPSESARQRNPDKIELCCKRERFLNLITRRLASAGYPNSASKPAAERATPNASQMDPLGWSEQNGRLAEELTAWTVAVDQNDRSYTASFPERTVPLQGIAKIMPYARGLFGASNSNIALSISMSFRRPKRDCRDDW